MSVPHPRSANRSFPALTGEEDRELMAKAASEDWHEDQDLLDDPDFQDPEDELDDQDDQDENLEADPEG